MDFQTEMTGDERVEQRLNLAKTWSPVALQNRCTRSQSHSFIVYLPICIIPIHMLPQKPLTFYNITPVNPNGMTVVDLGEMDEGPGLAHNVSTCHISLPPIVETRTQPHSNLKGARHKSLPPKAVRIESGSAISTGSVISSIEETDSGADNNSALGIEEMGRSLAGPSSAGRSSTMGNNLAMVCKQ
jgi:hypothetical protein